ncbi:MAG: 50S ribosomal protein L24 [bacterium]|nr:50S ribosomal protein L24 [bacterium]MBK8128596.1 50S ribosomal protein L24 [bacterium]
MKIHKNDLVQVVAGNDRGKRGKVLKVFPDKQRVIVEGVNFILRHTKPNQRNQQGGIVKREGTIHVSNVMLIDPKSGKPTRIGHTVLKTADGNKRVRVARISNEMIAE